MKTKKLCVLIMAATLITTGVLTPSTKVKGYDISESAKEIVSKMTIEERLGQMIMPDFRKWKVKDGKEEDLTELNNEVADIIDKYDLGGAILFAENVKGAAQTTKLVHDMQQVAINDKDGNIPLFITLDQEGGIVTRLGEGTNLPGNMAIGATRNSKAAYDTGYVIGRELTALGVNVNFGPVLDTNNNPENPVIGVRSISSNPDLVGQLGSQMAMGMQDQGLAATAKHFPGHGDTATDSHYGLPVVDKSLAELKETEFKPFKVAIDNGIDMIMTAHIQFPQIEKDTVISKLDGKEIGIPATLSDDLIDGTLRKELGYDGIVITDAMNMKAIADNFGEVEAVKLSIKAGIDILLMPTILRSNADLPKLDAIYDSVLEAIESGEISEDQINDSAERIVELKIKRGIIDIKEEDKTLDQKLESAKNIVGSKEHRELERSMSEEAITVVKNEDNILPLNPKEGEKVLLISPAADQLQSMKFGINRLISEGTMKKVNVDTHSYNGIGKITEELKAKMNEANYIIVNSLASNASHLKPNSWNNMLPKEVIKYAEEINKPAVLVSLRNPYDVAAQTEAKAQVIAYGFKGMDPTEGDTLVPTKSSGPNIPAAIGVIFGGVNPKGTLPVDIPALTESGEMDLSNKYYSYGYGLTDLTNMGTTSLNVDPEVSISNDVKINIVLKDIDALESTKYSAKVNFDREVFDFVLAESEDVNIVQNVENGILTLNLESKDRNAITGESKIVVTLKAKAKSEESSISITDVKVIDKLDREFTATEDLKTIKVSEIIPQKVGNLEGKVAKNEVLLTWDTPSSKLGITGYIIYKDGKEVAEVPVGTTAYTATSLKSNTIYGFKVCSNYSNGEVSKPVSINVRTKK